MKVLLAKRGDTISFGCTRTNGSGEAVDLTDVEIAATLLLGGETADFGVAKTSPETGEFTLTIAAGVSETLVPGVGRCDVEFTDGGVVTSTETFSLHVVEDVTNAA